LDEFRRKNIKKFGGGEAAFSAPSEAAANPKEKCAVFFRSL